MVSGMIHQNFVDECLIYILKKIRKKKIDFKIYQNEKKLIQKKSVLLRLSLLYRHFKNNISLPCVVCSMRLDIK